MAEKNNEKIVKQLFDLLGIADPFEISENDEGINIVLNTSEGGIIIGRHGDTLESLQLILSLTIAKETGVFKRVSLEVGDYKKNREDYLRSLALQTKERVMSEGREISLPNLKPWERRIVHMFFQNDKEVESTSLGEGRDRTLVVRPK